MVQLTAAQYAAAQANLRKNAPTRGAKLYASLPRQSAGRARTGRMTRVGKRIAVNPVTRRTGRVARSGGIRVARGTRRVATPHIRRASGGIGTLLVLFIGLGVTVAIVRNPKIVTEPLRFIGGVTNAVTSLSGK
jgi:hypothetical protein